MGLLCGVIWVFGILFYTLSVSQMGLALATPIKNTTAILGTLIGLVFFAEGQHTRVPEALVGSALVVACAIILGRTGERSGSRSFITPVGIVFALLAAVLFASYTAPLKVAMKLGLDTYRLIALMGIGSAVGGTLMVAVRERGVGKWLRQPLRDHLWSALAGALWALATITMTEAIRIIGLAVTWPVVNLNTVVTVACGIVLFHEISARKFWKTLLVGMLCAIFGAVLLGLAKM